MKEFFVHFRQRQLLHFFEQRNSFKVSFASMSGRERDLQCQGERGILNLIIFSA